MTYKSGLDPENDPVVFTTDYGLEIRYAKATTTYLSEYTYFSAGGYNWVIIGYDPSMYECVQDVSGEAFRDNPIEGGDRFTQFGTIDDSSAGTAILRDNFAIAQAAETDYEIGKGCVLCLCETYVGKTYFYPNKNSGNNYKGSNLQNYINNTVYGGTSELSLALQALPIVPQKLTTLYYNNATSSIENAYLFPLAGRDNTESFFYGTYLASAVDGNMAIGIDWWLRSGNTSVSSDCYTAHSNGVVYPYSDTSPSDSNAVRPAFVLEL